MPDIAVTMADTEQVTLSVEVTDIKGQPVADNLTWTVDNGQVISLQPSQDTMSCLCVAGNEGSAVVTVADPNNAEVTANCNFTVTAGAPSQIVITPGTPEPQPA